VKESIREKALELGFDDCRFTTAAPPPHAREFQEWLQDGKHGAMAYLERNAFKRVEPNFVLNEARSVISLATSYHGEIPQSSAATGPIARYARFADYHDLLAERLKPLSEFVTAQGGEGTRSLWYVDTGPLLERDLAQRAGLGFAGKHTNLISRKLGNWFFISEIITTLELLPDEPERNRCGTCERCLEACPTSAITAPFQLDARRCISYLTIELKGSIPEELRPAIGTRIYGCDACLEACPWNRFAKAGAIMRAHYRSDLDQPELVELLALDDAAFKQKFAGTPMLRTKRRGLLRNVCVALGNSGDESVLPALERAALDPEPLIAEHALWAITQIRQRTSPAVLHLAF
jgi:epoxyqueuosine reductase